MIPFNFQYFKPKTPQEAIALYQYFRQQGKKPFYFSGGTELITLGRLGLVYTDAVIDLKGIPEYQSIFFHEDNLFIGGGASLTSIEEINVFPLLSKTVSEIADRTSRNKITIGGNICGQIFYREAVLPLLLTDCLVGIVGIEGITYQPLTNVFNRKIQLKEEEFLFSILINKRYLNLPFLSEKRRKQWDIGYPLVTVAAIKNEQEIRMAFSGVCSFPFRSLKMEKVLNNKQLSIEERADRALVSLPQPILNDVEGSAEYRLFVVKKMIMAVIQQLEDD